MDSYYGGTFTNLLSDDSSLYDEGYNLNPTVETENIVNDVALRKSKKSTKLSKRSTNFTTDEDVCITSIWLNTSKDAIHGTDQNATTFWGRIYDEFIINMGQSGRTEQSIKNRWQDINAQCAKFIGYLNQINNRHQSGHTDHDRLREARELYAANNGKRQFKFEHCFNLLKQEKKWLDTSNKQANVEDIPISSEDNNESCVNKERPLGNKSSKEHLKRKQGRTEGGSSSTMQVSLINERWETKIAMERGRCDQRERLIALHQKATNDDEERKRIDGDRVEIDIMNKDTNGMEETEAAYWKMKKNEILRRNGLV